MTLQQWWAQLRTPFPPQIVEIPTHALDKGKVYVMLIELGSMAPSNIMRLQQYYHQLGVQVLTVQTRLPPQRCVRFVEIERPPQQSVELSEGVPR